MERIKFCRHCGELIENQWLHCPWCGREVVKRDPEWHSLLDESLAPVEEDQRKGDILLLDHLSVRLDALESELDAFLAGKH